MALPAPPTIVCPPDRPKTLRPAMRPIQPASRRTHVRSMTEPQCQEVAHSAGSRDLRYSNLSKWPLAHEARIGPTVDDARPPRRPSAHPHTPTAKMPKCRGSPALTVSGAQWTCVNRASRSSSCGFRRLSAGCARPPRGLPSGWDSRGRPCQRHCHNAGWRCRLQRGP